MSQIELQMQCNCGKFESGRKQNFFFLICISVAEEIRRGVWKP